MGDSLPIYPIFSQEYSRLKKAASYHFPLTAWERRVFSSTGFSLPKIEI